jgi:hypothetical protein
MTRIFLTALAVIAAVIGVIYQLHFKPIFKIAGWGRVIEEGTVLQFCGLILFRDTLV